MGSNPAKTLIFFSSEIKIFQRFQHKNHFFIKGSTGLSLVTKKLLANEKVKFDSVHPVFDAKVNHIYFQVFLTKTKVFKLVLRIMLKFHFLVSAICGSHEIAKARKCAAENKV